MKTKIKILSIAALLAISITSTYADHLEGCVLVCDNDTHYENESEQKCSWSIEEDIFYTLASCEIDKNGKLVGEIDDGEPIFRVPTEKQLRQYDKVISENFGDNSGEAEADLKYAKLYPVNIYSSATLIASK